MHFDQVIDILIPVQGDRLLIGRNLTIVIFSDNAFSVGIKDLDKSALMDFSRGKLIFCQNNK